MKSQIYLGFIFNEITFGLQENPFYQIWIFISKIWQRMSNRKNIFGNLSTFLVLRFNWILKDFVNLFLAISKFHRRSHPSKVMAHCVHFNHRGILFQIPSSASLINSSNLIIVCSLIRHNLSTYFTLLQSPVNDIGDFTSNLRGFAFQFSIFW